jgi:hypothetical protein
MTGSSGARVQAGFSGSVRIGDRTVAGRQAK